MKLYLITNQTPNSVTQSLRTQLTAEDHALLNRDTQAVLALKAAVDLEQKSIPSYILQLEASAWLDKVRCERRFVSKRIDSSRQPASKLRSSNRKQLRRLRELEKSVLLAFPVGGVQ